PGASPSLPLRMVAAGTGAFTPITLWIAGEGRYEPANFPSFVIDPSTVWWDWGTSSSTYKQIRADAFKSSDNKGWIVEAAGGFSSVQLKSDLLSLAMSDPVGSGYADDVGKGAVEACQADLDDLLAGIAPASFWITRMSAELSQAALATDLELAAAS